MRYPPRSLRCRFCRGEGGVAAIEAAMIFPVFIALTFAIFESGLHFFRTAWLEQAVTEVGRDVFTGRAPDSLVVPAASAAQAEAEGEQDLGRDAFFESLCNRMDMFADCDSQLSVDVVAFPSLDALLADTSEITCPNETGYEFDKLPYDPGSRNAYTRVRVCYVVRVHTPGVGLDLRMNPDGTRSLLASSIRRNEPYRD